MCEAVDWRLGCDNTDSTFHDSKRLIERKDEGVLLKACGVQLGLE